eukprot:1973189-Pyramimonas_sp.AAC.1
MISATLIAIAGGLTVAHCPLFSPSPSPIFSFAFPFAGFATALPIPSLPLATSVVSSLRLVPPFGVEHSE